jgi:hypothetical protein
MYVPMCRYCLTSIYYVWYVRTYVLQSVRGGCRYSRYCTAVLLSIVRTYVHTVVGTWWLSVQSLLYSCTVVR